MSHKKYRTEKNCLNCGTEVNGKFCPECGQENLETRENFLHITGHFISDYLHFDSKFFRSLVPLFTKPGFLTKEYWEGRRVRFIHPLRIFFFVTIIFIISVSTFYKRFGSDITNTMVIGDTMLVRIDSAYLYSLKDSAKLYLPTEKDSVHVADLKEARIKDMRLTKKLRNGIDLVFHSIKYVSFFLLPLYALIFKLLYVRRKSFYVDHLVYTMHVQTFAYCFLSVTLLLPFVIPLSMALLRQLCALGILVYIIFSLRYLYRQKWWKTILKSLLATIMLFIGTGIVIMIIAVVDAIFIQ